MIIQFRHKGLKKLYEEDSHQGVQAAHAARLRDILSNLDIAEEPDDMNLAGYRLHELSGERKGTWSVRVSRNWRVTFCFEGEDVTDVNYEDYH